MVRTKSAGERGRGGVESAKRHGCANGHADGIGVHFGEELELA